MTGIECGPAGGRGCRRDHWAPGTRHDWHGLAHRLLRPQPPVPFTLPPGYPTSMPPCLPPAQQHFIAPRLERKFNRYWYGSDIIMVTSWQTAFGCRMGIKQTEWYIHDSSRPDVTATNPSLPVSHKTQFMNAKYWEMITDIHECIHTCYSTTGSIYVNHQQNCAKIYKLQAVYLHTTQLYWVFEMIIHLC